MNGKYMLTITTRYVDFPTATAAGYISSSDNGPAYIGVDHTSVLGDSGVGRESVRIQTSKTFTHGLFILDASNMPGGACGTWPAWWSYGPNWPNSGEIDIIEEVNSATQDKMSLHTSSNCTVTGLDQTGTLDAANCADAGVGCGTDSNTPNSYGLGLTRTVVEFMQLNGQISTSRRGSSPGMAFQLILRMVLLIPADGDCPMQTSLAGAISIATFRFTSLCLTRISAPQSGLVTQRSGLLMRRAPLLRLLV
jgi:Glycosyl hydrolases family 16